MRVINVACIKPRAMAGRVRDRTCAPRPWLKSLNPETGSHRSLTAKSIINRRPSRKLGMEMPRSETEEMA